MELRKLKDKAAEAFTKGRFSKAAEIYEEYCRAEPKDHQSRLRMGDAWTKAGQRDRAISAYQAAAEGFAKEGFLPRAIAASKLILELDPSHQGVQQMLADLYARRGTGMRARSPAPSEAPAKVAPAAPEPTAKSRLPEAVRAAVAEIQLDVEPSAPASLEAGGAPIDLSEELPPELSLSVDAQTYSSPGRGAEAVVHSVSMGRAGSSPAQPGARQVPPAPPFEAEVDDAPVLIGEALVGDGGGDSLTSSHMPSVATTAPAAVASTPAPRAPAAPVPPAVASPPRPPAAPVTAQAAPTSAPRPPAPPVMTAPAAGASTPSVHASASQVSAPVAASPAAALPSAPSSAAPVAAPPGTPSGTSPALAASAPRPQEGARPSTSTLPPGLAPRSTQRVAAVTTGTASPPPASETPATPPASSSRPSGKWKALSSPIADGSAEPTPDAPRAVAEPPVAAPTSAPPGLRPRRAETPAPAGATALPFRELSPGLGASLHAAAGSSAFTELELEADSLLHAVELAAQAGLSQRAAMAQPQDEEEVFSLTEEVGPESPSLDALPTIPLFSDLPRDAFIELFERCPLRRFGPGERIIEQGSHGDAFYVICEGSVRVFREDAGQRHDLATLEGGTFFGEMALLSGAPRTASVEGASEDTQLLEISAAVLATLSRSYPQVAQALKKFCRQRLLTNVMNSSALFRPFNKKDRRTLVERFRARDVERDDVIIRDGDLTDGLYVVLSGEVSVSKDGHLLTTLKEGDLFGEISLLQKTPATATVKATRHTTVLRLPREDFDALISSHPQILVLVSELSDERLRRTERVLGSAGMSAQAEGDEELVLV